MTLKLMSFLGFLDFSQTFPPKLTQKVIKIGKSKNQINLNSIKNEVVCKKSYFLKKTHNLLIFESPAGQKFGCYGNIKLPQA